MNHPIGEELRKLGYALIDAGEYWRTSATFRGGRNPTSIAVHKKKGLFKDFALDTPWKPAELLILLIEGKRVDFGGYVPEEEEEENETVKIYPESTLSNFLPKFGIFPKRGISLETLKLFKAGYSMGNKMGNRVCFPIYDEHKRIFGFSGRWLQEEPPDKVPKWKHLGRKTYWIYPRHLNEDILREAQEVIIVESIGDLLALWEAGIKTGMCVFGTSLSPRQMAYILGIDPQRIILALNNDVLRGGVRPGQHGTQKIKEQLGKHFIADKIIDATPEKNDLGAMSSTEITTWYDALPTRPKNKRDN